MKIARLAIFPALVLVLSACKDVDDYTTKPDESFCGDIVQGPFVRDGFAPDVHVRLTFDAAAISSGPGIVSTSDGFFTEAKLAPIPQVFHDPLATLSFGEGRKRSMLYSLTPTRAQGGAPLMAVVSLMEGGNVELRLFRAGDATQTQTPSLAASYFGVFPLHRQKGTCF